jgi:hypothetical protein
MKVEDLRVMLQHARDNDEVMIGISLPYSTVGAYPMVKVKSAVSGFDWEHGKFIIWPENNLYPADEELKESFKKLEKRASEFFIKNMELEKEVRRLKSALENKPNS